MIKMQMVDRRNGLPSMTRLAEAAGVHPSTVSEMMYGTRKTSRDVVDKVAAALYPEGESGALTSRRRRDVHGWVGRALDEATPFEPHPDADLLDAKERKVVNEMIRLLARSKRQGSRPGGLSVADDTVRLAAAADKQDQPAAGESESYNEP